MRGWAPDSLHDSQEMCRIRSYKTRRVHLKLLKPSLRRDVTATKNGMDTPWDIVWSEMGGNSNTCYMWTSLKAFHPEDIQASKRS